MKLRGASASSQPGRGVKEDPEEPAAPAAVESSPPGRDPAPAVSPVKDEHSPAEQGAAPAASPVKRRPAAKVPKRYHGEPPNFWRAHLPKQLWQRGGYCLLRKTQDAVDEDHLLSEQHIEEMFKMEARYEEQRQQAKAAEREAATQPALPAAANPVKQEVAKPSAASSSAGPSVKSEAEVQEAKQAVVASLTRTGGLSWPGRAEGPDRMKGEMSKEELQAIWSKEGRTQTAQLVESLLGGAADELRYQEACRRRPQPADG